MFDNTDLATKLVPSYKMSSQKLCTSYTADQYTRGVSKIKENEKCFRGRAQRLKTTDESDTAVYCCVPSDIFENLGLKVITLE